MKTIIHVNRHIIAANTKNNERVPPLTIKTYRETRRCSTARIKDADGAVVAEILYRPDHPLPCGARVWIETRLTVECV